MRDMNQSIENQIIRLTVRARTAEHKLALEREHSAWLQKECDSAVDVIYKRNAEVKRVLQEEVSIEMVMRRLFEDDE